MDRRGKGGQENQWKARNDVDSNLVLSQNLFIYLTPSSVQFNCLVMSDSLWPCGLQHTSLPCPSPTPGAYSNHVHWVGDAIQPISSSVVSSPPAFNLSQHRVFSNESVLHIRRPKYWSFSFSISPSNEYSRLISFRTDWWISLQSKGLSRVFSNTTVQKHQFFSAQLSL